MANQALVVTRGICRWGIGRGDLAADPTLGLKRSRTVPRERSLAETELKIIWQATGDGTDYGRIVRLLLLTGQRRGEWGAACWNEINVERAQLELPGSRTKNRRAHIVPLSPLVLAQLPPRRDGYLHLFGRGPERGFSGWSKEKRILDERVGGLAPWTLHDLRRTFVTQMAERGLASPATIELIVNHLSGHRAGVAGIYNRSLQLAERRAALERWANAVGEMCCP